MSQVASCSAADEVVPVMHAWSSRNIFRRMTEALYVPSGNNRWHLDGVRYLLPIMLVGWSKVDGGQLIQRIHCSMQFEPVAPTGLPDQA